MKYLLREVDNRTLTGEEPLLSMRQEQGLVPFADVSDKEIDPEFLVGYKIVRPGQFVMNRMQASNGMFAKPYQEGLVSPDYAVLEPVSDVSLDFLSLLFKSVLMRARFRAESKGLGTGTAGFLRLYTDRLGAMSIALPTRDEQDKIVQEVAALDSLVAAFTQKKRDAIALLHEQKSSVIDRLMSKGLRDVPMRDCHVDWIKSTPEHWIVKPLKRWVGINEGSLPETTDDDYEFSYVDIGSVSTGVLIDEPERMRFGDSPSRARRILQEGDTILSTVRTYLRATYFFESVPEDLIASTGFAVLSPNEELVPEYLSLAIQNSAFIDRVIANSVGVAYPAIGENRLGAFHLACPPSKKEQEEAVSALRMQTHEVDVAIKRASTEVDLVREYRTRVVEDLVLGRSAVTGDSALAGVADAFGDSVREGVTVGHARQ